MRRKTRRNPGWVMPVLAGVGVLALAGLLFMPVATVSGPGYRRRYSLDEIRAMGSGQASALLGPEDMQIWLRLNQQELPS